MSSISTADARYFAWQYFRAFTWVVLASLALRRTVGDPKVSRAYFGAHMAALGFGAAVDAFMVTLAPKAWLSLDVLQWVFFAPIVVFTVISLWIASWKAPVHASDAFMTMVPVAAWGLLVVFGWQKGMWRCHVLGAWFVSAACGAVDLRRRFGPPAPKLRARAERLAAYAAVIMAVYLLLPRTE